ncbi:MAG TPA: STAS domain-containing protein [Bryobacteraceae bacterium]|jgi:anti-sigma B factor antagonist|nr:STAS domain-containing protein [Bryobacteraceae bacterium]
MDLVIEETVRDNVTILRLKGRLIAGQPTTDLRDKVKELVQLERTRIVLDLAGVDYIDSTGLGQVVIGFTTVQRAAGALKLLNLNRRNIELLVLTKLSTVFEIFDDETEAVNSFFPNREFRKFDILAFVQQQRKL